MIVNMNFLWIILKRLLCLPVPGHAGKSLEISNLVDIRSQVNCELVMKIVSDVASGNRFYSDLNGFQVFTQFCCFYFEMQSLLWFLTEYWSVIGIDAAASNAGEAPPAG